LILETAERSHFTLNGGKEGDLSGCIGSAARPSPGKSSFRNAGFWRHEVSHFRLGTCGGHLRSGTR